MLSAYFVAFCAASFAALTAVALIVTINHLDPGPPPR